MLSKGNNNNNNNPTDRSKYVNIYIYIYNISHTLWSFLQADNKVKILSGGGSGHEPFCAGKIF